MTSDRSPSLSRVQAAGTQGPVPGRNPHPRPSSGGQSLSPRRRWRCAPRKAPGRVLPVCPGCGRSPDSSVFRGCVPSPQALSHDLLPVGLRLLFSQRHRPSGPGRTRRPYDLIVIGLHLRRPCFHIKARRDVARVDELRGRDPVQSCPPSHGPTRRVRKLIEKGRVPGRLEWSWDHSLGPSPPGLHCPASLEALASRARHQVHKTLPPGSPSGRSSASLLSRHPGKGGKVDAVGGVCWLLSLKR